MSCYKTGDNKHLQCPPRMDDGRHFTDYRPNCELNANIKLDNKFKLVEASAGTGKSFTLAHLVLRNVLEKKIKPDEILLLSFTKKQIEIIRYNLLDFLII